MAVIYRIQNCNADTVVGVIHSCRLYRGLGLNDEMHAICELLPFTLPQRGSNGLRETLQRLRAASERETFGDLKTALEQYQQVLNYIQYFSVGVQKYIQPI